MIYLFIYLLYFVNKFISDACNDRDDILIKYKNCRVLKNGVLKHDDIWVKDGSIIDPMMVFYKETRMPDMTIDCNGLLASPGFIDLQVNGIYTQSYYVHHVYLNL